MYSKVFELFQCVGTYAGYWTITWPRPSSDARFHMTALYSTPGITHYICVWFVAFKAYKREANSTTTRTCSEIQS